MYIFIKDFIIDNSQSFSVADNPSFLKFVYCLNKNYVPPNRDTIKHRVKEQYKVKKEEIKKLLKTSKKVNLTSDIWSSITMEPYISLTAHFVTDNWKMINILLDISYFPHPHDGPSISEQLTEVTIFEKIFLFYIYTLT